MKWRKEYDSISQQGFIGRPDGDLYAIAIPQWMVEYLQTHKMEDIDHQLVTAKIVEACKKELSGWK